MKFKLNQFLKVKILYLVLSICLIFGFNNTLKAQANIDSNYISSLEIDSLNKVMITLKDGGIVKGYFISLTFKDITVESEAVGIVTMKLINISKIKKINYNEESNNEVNKNNVNDLTNDNIDQYNAYKDRNVYSLYINQPSGFLSKIRIKFENRFTTDNSILFTYTNYYEMYTGNQYYVEFRQYKEKDSRENFNQIKLGIGESEKFSSVFVFLGGAVGQKFYISKSKKIALDITEGLKLPLIIKGNPDNAGSGLGGLFYLVGPGSIIDINFNFSYQF